MSAPLPPGLTGVERLLEASRSPLPPELRAKVLAAASKAVPAARPARGTSGWFAAAVGLAAALLLNLSNSAAVLTAEPRSGQADQSPVPGGALVRALLGLPEPLPPPGRRPTRTIEE